MQRNEQEEKRKCSMRGEREGAGREERDEGRRSKDGERAEKTDQERWRGVDEG